MSDIPNRPLLEKELAESIANALGIQFDELMGLLGDPPAIDNLPYDYWEQVEGELVGAIKPEVQAIFMSQAEQLLKELPIGVSDWGLVNTQAIEWANSYTFDLVRKLNNTTREGIRKGLEAFFQDGSMTIADLADSLTNLFGPVRAEMIAVTEVTRASVQGELALVNLIEGENPHIRMKGKWHTARDDRVCEICGARHDKYYGDGWTEYPPAHPRCRCWVNHEMEVI
jgi:hypothetical protein